MTFDSLVDRLVSLYDVTTTRAAEVANERLGRMVAEAKSLRKIVTLGTTVANLGMDGVKFPKPVRIGDTLRSETVVLEKRESKSRPNDGIVVFEHRSFNQKGEEVAYCRRSALMKKKPA